MTETATGKKPPAPAITRGLQVLGLVAVIGGGLIMGDAAGCSELDCLAWPIGIVVAVWGLVALLSGIRGTVGLLFLIAAIVLPLTVLWVKFLWLLGFLLLMMLLVRVSKDRLAGYYRKQPGGES